MSESNYQGPAISLELLGIITGIVLCILQGVNVIDIGWFWATFPFWIVIAVDVVIIILTLFVVGIVALFAKIRDGM